MDFDIFAAVGEFECDLGLDLFLACKVSGDLNLDFEKSFGFDSNRLADRDLDLDRFLEFDRDLLDRFCRFRYECVLLSLGDLDRRLDDDLDLL